MINGMINVYKECGFTSHDVVAKLRGILRQKKIGHTGTLDPQAEGVLPVCLGNATKLCEFLTDKNKEYVTQLQLGIITDTQDMTGNVLCEAEPVADYAAIQEAVNYFHTTFEQLPPMYSAKKINGKRLYELAREGKTIERSAVPVTIEELEILSIDPPFVKLRVVCSKGTYIRTLCHDIGTRLGCGASMKSLLRTRSGEFNISDSLKLTEIEKYKDENRTGEIIKSVESIFETLQSISVNEKCKILVANGNKLLPGQVNGSKDFSDLQQVRVYDESGSFYGIYAYHKEKSEFVPVKMFLEQEG